VISFHLGYRATWVSQNLGGVLHSWNEWRLPAKQPARAWQAQITLLIPVAPLAGALIDLVRMRSRRLPLPHRTYHRLPVSTFGPFAFPRFN
jgi:hypothetical protein